jgi:hypothetical protein
LIEVVGLALCGTFLVWVGRRCLLRYREEFSDDPRRTITLDVWRAVTGSFSWAMAGALFFSVGIVLCVISALVSLLYLSALLGLFE